MMEASKWNDIYFQCNLSILSFITWTSHSYSFPKYYDYANLCDALRVFFNIICCIFLCQDIQNICFIYTACPVLWTHYGDVMMSPMASQITGIPFVCSTVYSGADQRKYQNSTGGFPAQRASNAKMSPFHDVIKPSTYHVLNLPSYERNSSYSSCVCVTYKPKIRSIWFPNLPLLRNKNPDTRRPA